MMSAASPEPPEAHASPAGTRPVADLRAGLADEQRDLLNAVWERRMAEGRWPASADVRLGLQHMDGRAVAERLGGSVIQEHPSDSADPDPTYRLTTLGMFLTDKGPRLEALLLRYLHHVRGKLKEDHKLSDTTFKELREKCAFGDRQLVELQLVLFGDHGYVWNTGGSPGPDGCATKSPRFEELLRVDDLDAWIQRQITARHAPEEPVDLQQRQLRAATSPAASGKRYFEFIADTKLRSLLEADYGELERAYSVRAWKACVILAGAIVEGMLLDAMYQDPRALDVLNKRYKNAAATPTEWELKLVVRTAKDLEIIRSSSADLGEVVRVFRNLVHPARQVAENMPATKELADSARSTVELLRAELGGRHEQRLNLPQGA